MQGGDISNEVTGRVLFVFEGLVAKPPTGGDGLKAKGLVRLRRWGAVARLWQIEPLATKQMWDLVWRRNLQFEVVTFLYEERFAASLWQYLDEDLALPISRVLWYESPQALARDLALMPSTLVVLHAFPSASLFGSKGKYVADLSRDPLA